jgi:hypothetical protein
MGILAVTGRNAENPGPFALVGSPSRRFQHGLHGHGCDCGVSNRFSPLRVKEKEMGKRFKVGDHVTWNSEAGHVSGRIIKVHRECRSTPTLVGRPEL